ncbi:MAG: zinc-dependent metalloprotease [Myxococcota bacterium]|nr:zinc-dependent metalloprotease [Myxococcota bacterium]
MNRNKNDGAKTMLKYIKNISIVVALATLAACAGEVGEIDRTQPNKIQKSLFEGEWYSRMTIIENQFNQGMMFEGYQGDMERIRWEVRESELIGYRSYELLEGAEDGNGDLDFHGTPVVAFPIQGHFDVIRDYNSATGEQSNVLVENGSDKPWYEREYMRVDWTTNLVTDYDIAGILKLYINSAYYMQPNEIDSPYRVEIGEDNINVVLQGTMAPDIQTCYYTFFDPYFCGNSEVKAKFSFMKVKPRNYTPLYHPDYIPILDAEGKPLVSCSEINPSNCSTETIEVFERFGLFRTERRAYDDEYQWTRDGRIYLGNRWNIWETSQDAQGNIIHPALRTPKAFTYHSNADFPTDNDISEATDSLVAEWDRAFRETVYYIDQLAVTDPPDSYVAAGIAYTAKYATVDDVPTIYRWQKNSCNIDNVNTYASANGYTDELANFGIATVAKGNLKRACSILEYYSEKAETPFTWEKAGDLRYSFLHWVDTPQAAGPLGYGPSSADPITGEIISANANMYGSSIDTYASYAADVVSLMNGDSEFDEIMYGENIRADVDSWGNGGFNRGEHPFHGGYDASDMESMSDKFKEMAQDAGDNWLPSADDIPGAAHRAKLDRVIGSDIEKELLASDDLKRLLGPSTYQPGMGLTDEGQDFSPLSFMRDDLMQKHFEMRRKFAENSIMMTSFEDTGIASLAAEMAQNAWTWEQMYSWFRKEIYRGVMAHEVGHTLGLRHNFSGSIDALNFHDEFWDSYDETSGKIEYIDSATQSPTSAERYMYSSIMDYDARFFADSLQGIGKYDVATIKFGYGNLIETFDVTVPALYYENLLYLHDYNAIPKILSGTQACAQSSGADCDDLVIDAFTAYQGNDTTTFNRKLNTYLRDAPDNVSTPSTANISKRGHTTLQALKEAWTTYYNGGDYAVPSIVPYEFCPDEYSYASNVTCQPYDKGATYADVTTDRMERYDSYYAFRNFKRNRISFNDFYINSYLSSLIGRTFSPMSTMYRYYLYSFSGIGYDDDGNYLTLNDFPIGQDWQKAGLDGLNNLARVINQPEPGTYCKDGTTYKPLASGTTCTSGSTVDVGVGEGRYYYSKWTDEYYYKPTVIGSFYDKYAALWSLTDNEGSFYQDFSDLLDSGAFSLSYWRGLQDEMLETFSGAYTDLPSKFNWRVRENSDGKELVAAPVSDIYDTWNSESDYDLPTIESPTSWTLRYYGILLPMARFNSYYDYTQDFSHYARICLEGYSDCVDYGQSDTDGDGDLTDEDASSVVEYVDPLSGYKYLAAKTHKYGSGGDADVKAVGARMLEEAQGLATIYDNALDAYTADNSTDNLAILNAAEEDLNAMNGLVEVVRQFSYLMEYGG